MRRLVALCILGLAGTGCSLDFGQNDQSNDGDDQAQPPDDPPDLPGDEYRNCVLDTLQTCDDQDLTPNECTALIAATCNDGGCDPNTMDPDGTCPPPCDPSTGMGCCQPGDLNCDPPPPDDCFQTVFDECIAEGLDPMTCALRADLICNPQCQPGDPNCEPCDPTTMNPDGSCPPPCDPSTGMGCCDAGDPNCEPPPCDPSTGQGCDCWTLVFTDCIAAGLDQMTCALRADETCYPPPPCQDATDPNCWPCDPSTGQTCPCTDPMDPNCWPPPPPPPCDPTTGENCDCWSIVFEECIASGLDQMTCAARADETCYPPPPCDPSTGETCVCTDPMDPNCWPPDPPPPCNDPMDPNCLPPDPPPCSMGDPNCVPFLSQP